MSKNIKMYLLFTFTITWGLFYLYYFFASKINISLTVVLSILMFIPSLSVLLIKLFVDKTIHIKLAIKIKDLLLSWLLTIILIITGSIIYFVIFPNRFSFHTMAMMQSYPVMNNHTIITIILAAIFTPLFNSLFAIGEEVGWRGFLYPQLEEKYHYIKANILVGIIWGLWHAPFIMIGYNYGNSYQGFPFLGIIMMIVFCIFVSFFLNDIYSKSKSVLPCALAHGTINAFSGIGILFAKTYNPFVGPMPLGIIGLFPFIIYTLLAIKKHHQ